jgi:hypothetical protein
MTIDDVKVEARFLDVNFKQQNKKWWALPLVSPAIKLKTT